LLQGNKMPAISANPLLFEYYKFVVSVYEFKIDQ